MSSSSSAMAYLISAWWDAGTGEDCDTRPSRATTRDTVGQRAPGTAIADPATRTRHDAA
jgi:hypothetical protein